MTENQDDQALRVEIGQLREKVDEMVAMKEQMSEIVAMKDKMIEMLAMKDQMANIMTLLEKKAADESISVGNTENVTTSLPPTHNSGFEDQGYNWPPYGLPAGYVPPKMDTTSEGAPTGVTNPNHSMPQGLNEAPQVQIPMSTIPPAASQSYAPLIVTSHQIPTQNDGNPSHSHIPYVNSAAIPMFHSYNYPTWNPQPKDKLQMLEERMKAVEGSNTGAREAYDLCLVPNVVIPPKFKVPDFGKYKGTTCPASHLTMYCRKMAAFAHDDKLLIHYFQDSLAGASLDWYMQLEPTQIRCWKDLADAFLRHYKYNTDMAPDRTQLQSMTKKENESFKEYAQRWRGLAAQVAPPLLEKEMVLMFMDTLPPLFYDRLIGSVSSSFSDMVVIGERLENGMRNGKIAYSPSGTNNQKKPFSGFPKKREGETNAITGLGSRYNPPPNYGPQSYPAHTLPSSPHQNHPNYRPQNYPAQTPQSSPHQNNPGYRPQNYLEKKPTHFDPIPMTYTDLFNHLATHNIITPRPMKPIQPPFSRTYNPNATCGFHAGAVGHTIEDCKAFKSVVQELIDSKWLTFEPNGPNVATNPLPGHGGPSTNAIEDLTRQSLIRRVQCIQTPLEIIHAELCHFGVIAKGCVGKDACTDPHCVGACDSFKPVLQDLLDRHLIQVGFQEREENVSTLQSDNGQNRNVRRPLKICYDQDSKLALNMSKPTIIQGPTPPFNVCYDRNSKVALAMPKPIVIQVPSPFPFDKANAVPWNYNVKVQVKGPQDTPNITNISGSSGMTRSGRIYTPEILSERQAREEEERIRKGKDKEPESTGGNGRKLSEQEAGEFLKIMRQSEYKVVDQLNQTPAKISLLSLLLNSEAHRATLMKVLNEAHVSHDITVNQFDGIVGNIVASNYLTFTDDEIPAEGRGHNHALHISVKCGEFALARVLIDNGSSLNVLPKSTMDKLDVDCSYMKPSATLVRAFDGSKREVIGEMELPVQVGPEVFTVVFQVMDIAPSYSCLLGRPWIHSAGAVPSSLHQKLKFVVDNKLIVVSGEEEMIVNRSPSTRYIEAAEESFETAFQALEIANAIFVGDGVPSMKPKLSKTSLMVAKVMTRKGYQAGSGLGKAEQGILTPIQLLKNKDRHGIGYWPGRADRGRLAAEKRERRLAKLEGREPNMKKIVICDIKQSFQSAGMLDPDQVAAVEDNPSGEDGGVNLVRRCPASEKLKNWEIVDFPVVFSSE